MNINNQKDMASIQECIRATFKDSIANAQKKSLKNNNAYVYSNNNKLYIKFPDNTSFIDKLKISWKYEIINWK